MLTLACLEEKDTILRLEQESFPSEEAASDESLTLRLKEAQEYFYSLKIDDGEIIGFVNGTCVASSELDHDCMTSHVPGGPVLVIHSVTVDKRYRRRHIATGMLKKYLEYVSAIETLKEIKLLTKARLISFYLSCGFKLLGPSLVIHGSELWFEMSLTVNEEVEQVQIDAFTSRAFGGNPAAVVFQQRDESWMQNVAMENNLAETAFISPIHGTKNSYNIRWFTPIVEVDLCGHATLAAASALYTTRRVPYGEMIEFHSLASGSLFARMNNIEGTIELDFPTTPPTEIVLSPEEIELVCSGFGLESIDIRFVGRSTYDLVIEISRKKFEGLKQFNFSSLATLGGRGVVITCPGVGRCGDLYPGSGEYLTQDRFDCVSRCFFPCCGINEDPVTGSAHCAIGPYWAKKLGKDKLVACQASKRGGVLHLTVNEEQGRILLGGHAVQTLKGRLIVHY